MKRTMVLLAILLFLFSGVLLVATNQPHDAQQKPSPNKELVTIENTKFSLYTPRLGHEQKIGLAAYDSLGETEGMVFDKPREQVIGIWMKNMKFDIDILWVDNTNTVIHIEHSVKKESYPHTYYGAQKKLARYVIELSAGAAEKYGIHTGSAVKRHQ